MLIIISVNKRDSHPALPDLHQGSFVLLWLFPPAGNRISLLPWNHLYRCDPPEGHVEVIVVLNLSENADPADYHQSLKTAEEIHAMDEEAFTTGIPIYPY